MIVARFKSLCMDATDARPLARFWAGALGGRSVDLRDGGFRVDRAGVVGNESLWIDPVPEPRSGKTRAHMDLRLAAADVTPLVDLGAVVTRVPDDEISWWVLTDVDGNVFCAFPPRDGTSPGVFELIVDSADPVSQATWWADVCGGEVTRDGIGAAIVGAAGFPWDYWVFDAVPEPKTVKNRVHWDVDLTGPDPSALVAAGASVLRAPDDEISWWIMADPEGNEFCAFARNGG
jgi:hypothetical protein